MTTIGKKSLTPLIITIVGIIIAVIVPLSASSAIQDGGQRILWISVHCVAITAIVIYHAYFLITLPKNIILLNDETDEVTVFVSRWKKVSFNVREIKNLRRTRPTITFWRIVANLTFVLTDGRKIRARFITDPDGVAFALFRKK